MLGSLRGANFNSTADQAIPLNSGGFNYIITTIYVTNASGSLTTAAGGIYDAASKGGNAIVAATQAYSALSASSKLLALTLAALGIVLTAQTINLSLTTGQGAAMTADIFVFGKILN